MSKSTKKQDSPVSPVTLLWLQAQFDQIDKANALILAGVNDLKSQNAVLLAEIRKVVPSTNVTPALEAAVNSVWMQAKRIDLQVPDAKSGCNPNKQQKG